MLERREVVKVIEKAYKRGLVFAIDINGNIYVGTEENADKKLEVIENASPIIMLSNAFNSVEEFMKGIFAAACNCAEYIDYYGDMSDTRVYKRYNVCLDLMDIIEEELEDRCDRAMTGDYIGGY